MLTAVFYLQSTRLSVGQPAPYAKTDLFFRHKFRQMLIERNYIKGIYWKYTNMEPIEKQQIPKKIQKNAKKISAAE